MSKSMHFSIRHVTRFRYDLPVRETVMELRMQPRSEGRQTLRHFQIVTSPRAQLHAYTDHLGNAVYHFNVLRPHMELRIEAESVVECLSFAPPDEVDDLEWDRYNRLNLSLDHLDLLQPSRFAQPATALSLFMQQHDLVRPSGNPMTSLKALNHILYEAFEYEPGITEVHSPIEHALREGRGVCQDFAHIMIAVCRSWRIPARYVSGYLCQRRKNEHRSGDDATHAWVEAWLPSCGWTGFGPTNDIMASERHLRVAVGRDYADVPPTRGTFRGDAQTELAISVRVEPTAAPTRHEEFLRIAKPMKPAAALSSEPSWQQQQQQ